MKCPTCGDNTPDSWKPLWRDAEGGGKTHGFSRGPSGLMGITADYMHCAVDDCQELVIRVHQTVYGGLAAGTEEEARTVTWYACPRTSTRQVDPLVPETFHRDYREAAAILDLSPRMSAVLARKIVGDLLAEYAQQEQRRITQQMQGFVSDTNHPRSVRENLHHLREIADFGAHTQKNERDEIVEATREEAEWTLGVVDRLFDYFIVTPQKDAAVRAAFDQKIAQVPGRKPITPLPDDPPVDGS